VGKRQPQLILGCQRPALAAFLGDNDAVGVLVQQPCTLQRPQGVLYPALASAYLPADLGHRRSDHWPVANRQPGVDLSHGDLDPAHGDAWTQRPPGGLVLLGQLLRDGYRHPGVGADRSARRQRPVNRVVRE
jgi:hypothetical protein